MTEVLGVLDSREKAILVWLAIGTGLALRSRDIRGSLTSLLGTLLSGPILKVLAALASYSFLIVFVGFYLGAWNTDMAKDTLIWLAGPALVMVFTHEQANRDPSYFKKTFLATLEIGVGLAFLVNFYVLHLVLELMLIPTVFFITALIAYAQIKTEYSPVNRLLRLVLGVIGMSLLVYAAVNLVSDVDGFVSNSTLRLFLLPIALTCLFMPFVYALALYTGYETIFVRARIWIHDREVVLYMRRLVFMSCLFRLTRVNRFLKDYVVRLSTIQSKSDAISLIKEFRIAR